MNHDSILMSLATSIMDVIEEFNEDIDAIPNNKIKVDCRQNMDKVVHWAILMAKLLDDLNCYLSFFGGKK